MIHQRATPMTHAVDGRRFIVITAVGHVLYQTTRSDYVIAFVLPKSTTAGRRHD